MYRRTATLPHNSHVRVACTAVSLHCCIVRLYVASFNYLLVTATRPLPPQHSSRPRAAPATSRSENACWVVLPVTHRCRTDELHSSARCACYVEVRERVLGRPAGDAPLPY